MTGPDERDGGVATAWRLLSSPRVFFGLTLVLGVVLAWAQTVPQRPLPGQLAGFAPYAEAEALAELGLDDVWVSWPFFLVTLLVVLVGAGLVMARRRATPGAFVAQRVATTAEALEVLRERLPAALGHPRRLSLRVAPGRVEARRGFELEGRLLVAVGLVALAASLFIGRRNGFDARFTLVPGDLGEPSSVAVRDGDLFLPRASPLDLRCQRPDPMDPLRRQACALVTQAGGAPEAVELAPGRATSSSSDLVLSPLTESLASLDRGQPLELILRRSPTAPPERLALTPGQTIELGATGDRLATWAGPDGPLVLVTGPSGPLLLAPPLDARRPAATGLSLELAPPTRQVIAGRARPERLLTTLGLLLLAAGLLALAWPSLHVELVRTDLGTRVDVRGSDAVGVTRAAAALGGVSRATATPAEGTP